MLAPGNTWPAGRQACLLLEHDTLMLALWQACLKVSRQAEWGDTIKTSYCIPVQQRNSCLHTVSGRHRLEAPCCIIET